MKLAIKATHITLTDAIKAYVEQKVNGLEAKVKRFGPSVTAECEVGLTTKHHKKGPIFRAELHVRLPGKLVYAEHEDLNLYTAIGEVKREAERQIADYKGTLTENLRKAKKSKGGRA
jgi:putative sigma-54 modulation protein